MGTIKEFIKEAVEEAIDVKEEYRDKPKEYWMKAYVSMEKAARKLEKENADLRGLLAGQVNTNDQLGKNIETHLAMQEVEIQEHNDALQGMAKEIKRLRAKVVELGGNPD